MKSRHVLYKIIGIVAVLALVAAACGDDGGEDTTAAPPAATTEAPAPTTEAPAATTEAPAATTTAAPEPTTTAAPADECAIENLNLVTPGTLTIATGEPVFPPWMLDDDPTNGQGFESSVAYAIATIMGFSADQVEWVRTGFDEAIAPGPKDYDFNIQQYSITDDRDEVVDFSDPYYTTTQALIAYEDSPVIGATTIEELKALKLGAAIGTTSLDYVENVIQPDEEAAVYNTNADAKAAMDAGQVDGVVFDLPTAYYITAVEIPDAAIVGSLAPADEAADNFGLLFADGNPLVTCVNEAIATLNARGSLQALAERWLLDASDIPVITP